MPMVLTVTPVTQGVGYASIFTITGGPPNATIAWSSTKNGVPTGEDHSEYAGQVTDAQGNWSASGGNWPQSMIGEWEKIAYVYPPDGSAPWTAKADFAVVQGGGAPVTFPSGGGTTPTPTPVSSSGGLLEGSYNIGGFQIPKIGVYLSIAALALLVIPSGGGGRR